MTRWWKRFCSKIFFILKPWLYARRRAAKRLHVCLPESLRARSALQSGCLFLAGRCRLISFDRLPLRPTANTRSQESRHFHHGKASFSSFLSRFLCPQQQLIQNNNLKNNNNNDKKKKKSHGRILTASVGSL